MTGSIAFSAVHHPMRSLLNYEPTLSEMIPDSYSIQIPMEHNYPFRYNRFLSKIPLELMKRPMPQLF